VKRTIYKAPHYAVFFSEYGIHPSYLCHISVSEIFWTHKVYILILLDYIRKEYNSLSCSVIDFS